MLFHVGDNVLLQIFDPFARVAQDFKVADPLLRKCQRQHRRRGDQPALRVQIVVAALDVGRSLAHDLALSLHDVKFREARVAARRHQQEEAGEYERAQNRPTDDVPPTPQRFDERLLGSLVRRQPRRAG